jgi:LacI family transcriptional regulator
MPKIDHIVQASGVSRSTVFRYLAGKAVRPGAAAAIERAQRLLQAAPGTGPAETRDYLVSVVPTYTRFRGYAEVLEGVLQRVHETGGAVRIGGYQARAPLPSGVILVGKNLVDEEAELDEWKQRGVPCVLVNRIPDEAERSWVAVDCRRAAREAVTHLIGQGCRRIAVWIDELSRVSRDKKRGYCDALTEAGLPVDHALVVDPSVQTLDQTLTALLSAENPPDGWFSPDDEIAAQVISFASARGLSVPRDLAVVGMNDIATAAHLVPSLSSVRLPFRTMGGAAVDALDRLIEKPQELSVRILMNHELIVRDSSRRRGSSDL